ncbi:FH protein interacting protein FIP2-like [Humulus lupulus]|uniref:FH protein interacting protein FIP2-like n=1 Tax=Humulus lupulus TaxID=3486 RepID=UPI002B40C184|nr:FH protein interacting protein FIP2-like [Humulus lupulus]
MLLSPLRNLHMLVSRLLHDWPVQDSKSQHRSTPKAPASFAKGYSGMCSMAQNLRIIVGVGATAGFEPLKSMIFLPISAIGGKKFYTTVDTLTQREPYSMLATMFSGWHTVCQDPEMGFVFVDRDGKHFRHILNWLRDGVVPTLKDSQFAELLREAEYYQLPGLMEEINAILSRKEDEEDLTNELTRIDIIKCIQSEKVRFRGVKLSGLDLSKLDLSYVDFSHACLRDVFFSRANLQCAKFRVGIALK